MLEEELVGEKKGEVLEEELVGEKEGEVLEEGRRKGRCWRRSW